MGLRDWYRSIDDDAVDEEIENQNIEENAYDAVDRGNDRASWGSSWRGLI